MQTSADKFVTCADGQQREVQDRLQLRLDTEQRRSRSYIFCIQWLITKVASTADSLKIDAGRQWQEAAESVWPKDSP